MCAEDVEKLVNDRLRDLKTGGNLEDALRKEMDQAIYTPFTLEIEQAAPPKGFRSREPPKTLQKCHDPPQGRRRTDVQGVYNDLARSNSRLVPHPTIWIDQQLQVVGLRLYQRVHLLPDDQEEP
ncbi:unnamed protein product [Prunus armeniaca]